MSAKRPIGRPSTRPSLASTSTQLQSSQQSDTTSSPNDQGNPNPPAKRKRGVYNTYTLEYKIAAVRELYVDDAFDVGRIANKFKVPRSTLYEWVNQIRRKNKNISTHKKGCHLRNGSGRSLSYPKETDEELVEWILIRRDCHLPVSTELVKGKALGLIRTHNPAFKASKGWLEKFMTRNGLSLRAKTSISQKLPAQLERKIESFMTKVRALRAKHQYPLELILNMDETPMYFDMLPQYTLNKKGAREAPIRSSGADKKRLTLAVTCVGNGTLLPSLAIFKGKRKLKFRTPLEVQVTVQEKA